MPGARVHPAAAGVRHLARLAGRRRSAAGHRARCRPGPRRDRSGRPARSATTTSSASSTAASTPGSPPGSRPRPSAWWTRVTSASARVLDIRQDSEFDGRARPRRRRTSSSAPSPNDRRPAAGRADGGDVRPRRAAPWAPPACWPAPGTATSRVLAGGPEDWADATGQPSGGRPVSDGASGHRASGCAQNARPVRAAGRRQRPGRRHARPGADGPAAARRARSSACAPTPPASCSSWPSAWPRRPPTTSPAPGRTATAASPCWSPAGWSPSRSR